ncbi:uncharacterized protein CELE_C05E11.2 [Caenorhabditis elegans]|uniref:Secreted protein n=1 Tax=Caenorhabditis elegans TaxID=6239 RepID=Q17666_CAEEL|nr:Secreted protein [Caenorhabditis elegans]CCD63259.1 Secreted protein [Caenorhabditis elegans]|eukprot:NP_508787.1 Uncharacterized protein CELE_C05E11.2 [Caenorhabditis elegans]
MKLKFLSHFLLFALVSRPEASPETRFVVGVIVLLKIRWLIKRTFLARKRGVVVCYVMFPGQTFLNTAASTIRYVTFMIKCFLILIYSCIIVYLSDNPANRNTVAVYTLIFVLIHCWEQFLYGFYKVGVSLIRTLYVVKIEIESKVVL